MHTEVLPVDPASIARAAEVLRGGGLVAFPTETVYGLGANALDAAAVARIFAAKGRPPHNPIIVHVADRAHAAVVAVAWPQLADKLARQFWPGPLTLILPKRPEVPDIVTGGSATVGVRVPGHRVALALLRAAGLPIAAPSANRSSRISPTSAHHVLQTMSGRIDLILDGGPTPGGIESTVLDLTANPPRILRPGLLPAEAIEAAAGPVQRTPAAPASDEPLPSPGMMPRHYAPRTPVTCVKGDARAVVDSAAQAGQRVGWLTFAQVGDAVPPGVIVRQLPLDPVAAAAQLYAALHDLDDACIDQIIVALPPDTEAWVAIRDRLRRASS
jgi:L-threonylcarbamoyladenylate synthase